MTISAPVPASQPSADSSAVETLLADLDAIAQQSAQLLTPAIAHRAVGDAELDLMAANRHLARDTARIVHAAVAALPAEALTAEQREQLTTLTAGAAA